MKETKYWQEIKILGIAIHFQTSSFRRTTRILLELHPVSYNAVRRWIKKMEDEVTDFN